MEATRKYTIGNAELVAEMLEGEILQIDEVGTTHVHGRGGGGVISNGVGSVSEVRINSHTSWETKVWVNYNGKEVQWNLPGSLAFRPGHKIAICQVSDGEKYLTCFVKNVTTQEEWVLSEVINKEMFKTFGIDSRFSGIGLVILLLLSGLALLFNLITVFHVPAFIYTFIGLSVCTLISYQSLSARRKRNIEALTNMINDLKKNIPST